MYAYSWFVSKLCVTKRHKAHNVGALNSQEPSVLWAGEGVLRVVLFRSWHVAHCRDVQGVAKTPFLSCWNWETRFEGTLPSTASWLNWGLGIRGPTICCLKSLFLALKSQLCQRNFTFCVPSIILKYILKILHWTLWCIANFILNIKNWTLWCV